MKRRSIFFISLTPLFAALPAAAQTPPAPGDLITQYLVFAMGAAGLLAFGVVVWAGVKYILAAGNPGTQSDAKDQIWQAVIGILLLAGAGLVLTTINPGFKNLAFKPLTQLAAPSTANLCGGAPCPPSDCGPCDQSAGFNCEYDSVGVLQCVACPAWMQQVCANDGNRRCLGQGKTGWICYGPCGNGGLFGYCPADRVCTLNAGQTPRYFCAPKT